MTSESQIKWIENAPPEKKKYRGMIVGWQNSVAALNHLVSTFNTEYLQASEEKEKNAHHGMKEIAIKKLVVSSMVELKCKVDQWVARLNKEGEDTESVNQERKRNRTLLDKAEELRKIRNIGFHYGDVMLDPDDLAEVYKEIAKWDLKELNEILQAIYKIGDKAKNIALAKA